MTLSIGELLAILSFMGALIGAAIRLGTLVQKALMRMENHEQRLSQIEQRLNSLDPRGPTLPKYFIGQPQTGQ